MMRQATGHPARLLRLLLVCALAALPRAAAGQESFDPRSLAPAEQRILQAALTLSGDYVALLDGVWGPGSQRALDAFAARETGGPADAGAVAALVARFEAERVAMGWRMVSDPQAGLSHAEPGALLRHVPLDGLDTAGRAGIALAVTRGGPGRTRELHRDFLTRARPGSDPYQLLREDRMVTSAWLRGGGVVYLRSDPAGDGFLTRAVLAPDDQQPRLALIAASMQRGRGAELEPPAGGQLAALLALAAPEPDPEPIAEPLPDPEPEPVAEPEPDPETPPAVTLLTGFFVNNTDLVTAAAPTAACRNLTLDDGSALSPVARDEATGLAVLAAGRRSAEWLPVAEADAPPGAFVLMLGYADAGSIAQGVAITPGTLAEGPQGQALLDPPPPPGKAGGPVLGEAGAVVGVLRGGARAGAMVPAAELAAFLRRARVVLPAAAGHGPDGSEPISDSDSPAVVPVLCHG